MSDIEQRPQLADIQNEEDIAQLVHTFYAKVKDDTLLGPVFEKAIAGNWGPHLDIMCNFWSTMLLYSGRYKGDTMSKHMSLPIDPRHFSQWLTLFLGTVDTLFQGEVADNAKARAGNIARIMQSMMGFSLNNNQPDPGLLRHNS
ncbi:group III truncated hemoglobin [Chitinophaga rhizophila]|uniref:Group III truncated hemoglobin n=1 Tax=Chitinophaga rhizophila TaxID=2866212 RepID=A0ABS7GAT5_9BACT|nr:group III truncated hemoglobin [Chitinophaga rhizophila]MBW8684531.1 group III truncated hemoglobin [Chitinophaga rhizophila]